MIWLFRRGLFRPLGPAWLAFAAYRYWPAASKAKGRDQEPGTRLRREDQRASTSPSLSS
jgi:hypothetical protein